MAKNTTARGWCLTVNNYTDDDMIDVWSMYEDDHNCTYLIIGYEEGSRTKQPHLQCYVYYTNTLRFSEIKKRAPEGCHIEAQKASKNVEAYCYCMEDGSYIEYGDRPRQGHRTDLEVIKHDIEAGRPEKQIAQQYFSQWCQYGKRFDAYRDLIKPKYDTKIGWYDREKPMAQLRRIRDEYKNYFIVKDYIPWVEVTLIVLSSNYEYVFVPNMPGYADYQDDVEFALF